MEFRIENSSSQVKDFQTEGSWIPATPAKPVLAELHPICRDKGENKSLQANSLELKSVLQENSQVQASRLCQNSSASCVSTNSISVSGGLDGRGENLAVSTNSISVSGGLDGQGENLAGQSQCENNNITMYKNLSVDSFNKWDMGFQDLLALADAGALSQSENGKSSLFLSVPNALTEGKQVVKSPINLQPTMHQIGPGPEFQISSNSIPDEQQCRQHIRSHYFLDLNSTPATQSEADIISISRPSHFVPVTPDQTKKTENSQISDPWNSSRDERINEAYHKQGIGIAKRTSLEEQPQLLQDQSCGVVSTQPQVDLSPDKGANESSILNRTPTQKPRRRKHRPKVVIEGQPKRARKPRTPKSDTPKETPTTKRKYVRRKLVEKPTDTPEAEASETADSKTVRQTQKSCRRSLNFDAVIHVNDERSSCIHEQTLVTGVQSTVQLQYGLERTFEKAEVGIAYELTQSTNHVLEQYLSHPKNIDQPHTESVNDAQTAYRRGKCRIHFSDETHDKEISTVESPDDSICSTSAGVNKGKPAKGTKREHSEKIGEIEICTVNSMGAQYNSCQAYQPMRPDYGSASFPEMHFPVIFKKKRTEKGQQLSTSIPLSSEAPTEGFVRDMASDPFSLDSARRFSDTQLNSSNDPGITAVGTTHEQHYSNCVLAFEQMKKLKKKRTKGLTRVRDLASFTGNIGSNQWPTPVNEGASGVMQEFDASHQPPTCVEALAAHVVKLATRKRTKRNSTSTLMSSTHYYHQQSPSDQLGYPHLIWKSMDPVDALAEQFEHLHINRQHSDIANQEHCALVPYYTRYQTKNALVLYQRGGTLVPFEGSFNPTKRRKPRPKVELDDETTRVWKLLLEDINSQGVDGTDEDKVKWWEEERKVFRGRADSFIARMHLVQGDRRFSRWKGSVLDSVIGVFLTQNVSDHLSSSAFMSLAARYPLKSERDHGSTNGEKTSVSVREPEITEPDLDEAISWHEGKLSEPANDQSSMTLQDVGYSEEKEVVNSNDISLSSSIDIRPKDKSDFEVTEICGSNLTVCHESALSRSGNHISETVTKFMGDHREMDDVISSQTSVVSSQNSMDSSFAKSEEIIESCSQSNSRKEQIAGYEPSVLDGSLIEPLQRQRMATMHGDYTEEKADGSSNKIGQENFVDKAYSEEQNQAISTSCQAIPSSNILHFSNSGGPTVECFEFLGKENRMSDVHLCYEEKCASDQSGLSSESASHVTVQTIRTSPQGETRSCNNLNAVVPEVYNSQLSAQSPESNMDQKTQKDKCAMQQVFDAPNLSEEISDVTESTIFMDNSRKTVHKAAESNLNDHGSLQTQVAGVNEGSSKVKRVRAGKAKHNAVDWDSLRQQTKVNGKVRGNEYNTMDSLDYEAVRCADVDEIADTIKERGMNNMLAERIKDFLNRLVREHGSIDLEWLRDVPPDKAKEYLLSIRGLGLKSVECVRLLTLHHLAFPVDTNVGRIAVRLGWVPLQPLPESLQLHLLEMYPVLESIQKYLWPRLCKLDQRTLYELHYQMITFGKVFCTKSKPNCNACPMRGECRHFASAFASARLALPAPAEKSIVSTTENKATDESPFGIINGQQLPLPPPSCQMDEQPAAINNEPVIEEPATPGPIIEVPTTPEQEQIKCQEMDIEDGFGEDPDEIPTIKLNIEEFTQNLQNYMEKNMDLQDGDMSRALVALTPEVASIPTPKLKNVSRLRTEHQVYELPDSHPLLDGLDKREPDDPSSYLLAIWTPGETAESIQPPEGQCSTQELGRLCDKQTCFSCNSLREANSQTVRGTLLIPCRTAMRGSFPLNGTYFQVNEVFADHDSSLNPIDVPRSWIWNLPRRTVFFGTSIPTIFKGLTTEGIQYCFWRGFVCVRGFDQSTRAPRPLMARLHFPASKLTRTRGRADES